MERFRVLRVWILLGFTIFILFQIKTCAALNSETINLNPQLELFRDCSIQLLFHHITTSQGKLNFSEAYNVAPLPIPILLLSVQYRPILFREILNNKFTDTNCDGTDMVLLRKQGPKFRSIPDQKMKCFVQVLIDPLPCRKWTNSALAEYKKERPRGVFDFMLDRRAADAFTVMRRFVIHISRTTELIQNHAELLDQANSFWVQHSSVGLTKFIFLILFSKDSQEFYVVETSALTCKDYSSVIKNIKEVCQNSGFIAELACKYIQVHATSRALAPKLIYNNTSIQTRDELDNAIYSSINCQNIIWLAVLPTKLYSQKDTPGSSYVADLTSIQGQDNLKAKAVLFGILFPNATIVGYKYDEYLFLEAMTNWYLPAFHPHDMPNALLDTIVYSSKMKSVHFITCAPPLTSGWLSLIDLFSSFTFTVWILIILVSIVTGLCVWAILEMRNNVANCRNRGHSNGIWMAVEHIVFVWKILLMQGSSRSLNCWCICAAWLLMGTVLTNMYLCGNITNLSAPIEARNIESFEELFSSNFTIYSPVNNNQLAAMFMKLFKDAGSLGHLLYNTISGVLKKTNTMDHESILSILLHKNMIRYNYSKKFIRKILREKQAKQNRDTVEDVESHINEDQQAEIISQCKMEVHVDTDENIQRLKLKLSNKLPHHKIAVSKKPFDEMYENWELQGIPVAANIFLRRSHSLSQSGLIHWWNSWASRVSTWNMTVDSVRNLDTGYKAVSIEGNIQALFYLFLGIIALNFSIFVLEMGPPIWGCIMSVGSTKFYKFFKTKAMHVTFLLKLVKPSK
ncbi:unnamed protein product [Orchesella dallaii]|uniref:Ionotropic glutamate receptor C-terminal domain-containing protein n=1 Tax=Orchesella dallaii TaxID=48710 RepID=A0ABP1RQ49_9HEXA